MHTIVTPLELDDTLKMIMYLFLKNTRRKNAFLAVCYSINNEINLQFVNQFAELGGLIGPAESKLDPFFKCSKTMSASCILPWCVWVHEKYLQCWSRLRLRTIRETIFRKQYASWTYHWPHRLDCTETLQELDLPRVFGLILFSSASTDVSRAFLRRDIHLHSHF